MHLVLATVVVVLGVTAAIVPILLFSMHEPGWRRRPAGPSLVQARVDLDPLWRDWVPADRPGGGTRAQTRRSTRSEPHSQSSTNSPESSAALHSS
jgi:hypothetical protein